MPLPHSNRCLAGSLRAVESALNEQCAGALAGGAWPTAGTEIVHGGEQGDDGSTVCEETDRVECRTQDEPARGH
eukprot:scaffold208876_cov33-Tisochrysis_lutea.AAC.2